MRLIQLCSVAAIMAAQAACDPCAGIAGCDTDAHVTVTGQLLNDTTGRPERDAVIDVIRVGGVALERDSMRTRTDDMGLFIVHMPARETGDLIADIVVRPASGPGYRSQGLRIPTSRRGGEAFVLPPWSSIPHLADLAQLFRRGGPRDIIAGVDVEFRRTGGVAIKDLPTGVFRLTSDSNGMIPLFGNVLKPVDAGEVIGDLTIFLPDPPGATVHRDYRVHAAPDFRYAPRIHRIGAGPSLEYLFRVFQRGRPDLPAAGVTIEFQRTSGLAIDPPSWSVATDGSGHVIFPSRAPTQGVVTGDLTIRPAAPWKSYVLTGQQFPTFEGDSTIVAAVLGVGPGMPYYLLVRANGVPLPGARVDFQRVSGIEVLPSRFSVVTNDSGIAYVRPIPNTEGDIVADISVIPPSPYAAFTVRGLRMTAVDADVPGGRILLGDWDVTKPPSSAGGGS